MYLVGPRAATVLSGVIVSVLSPGVLRLEQDKSWMVFILCV